MTSSGRARSAPAASLRLSAVHGSQRYPWLRPGDRVRVEVEQLGAVETRILPGARSIRCAEVVRVDPAYSAA